MVGSQPLFTQKAKKERRRSCRRWAVRAQHKDGLSAECKLGFIQRGADVVADCKNRKSEKKLPERSGSLLF